MSTAIRGRTPTRGGRKTPDPETLAKSIMKQVGVAVLTMVLSACAEEPATALVVQPVGSEAWVAEVVTAAEEWTVVGCTIELGEGKPVEAVPVTEWPFPSHWMGATTPQGVFVIADLHPASRHQTLLHELGHALGLQHSDSGIMTERATVDRVAPSDCLLPD